MSGNRGKGNPKWKPGVSGNPNGRPKTGYAELEMLRAAVKKVEKRKGQSLYERAVEMAYDDAGMMSAVLRKLIPDAHKIEHTGDIIVRFDKQDSAL